MRIWWYCLLTGLCYDGSHTNVLSSTDDTWLLGCFSGVCMVSSLRDCMSGSSALASSLLAQWLLGVDHRYHFFRLCFPFRLGIALLFASVIICVCVLVLDVCILVIQRPGIY